MKTLTFKQIKLAEAREVLVAAKENFETQKTHVAELLAEVKHEREYLKTLRAENKLAREAAKAAKAQKIAADRAARIARMEAKLKALKEKQFDPKEIQRKNRKAGPVVHVEV